jgi:ADP-ribose pyrophosphatase
MSRAKTERSARSEPVLISSKSEYKGKRLQIVKRIFSHSTKNRTIEIDVLTFPVPKSVAILPITERGKVLLEKHYRFAPLQEIIEVPAGWLQAGEKPIDGARRELMEETGCSAYQLRSLGSILPAPGYSTEEIYLFIAKVTTQRQSNQSLELGEIITASTFSKRQVVSLIRSGRIRDAMTISSVYRARLKGLF